MKGKAKRHELLKPPIPFGLEVENVDVLGILSHGACGS